MTWNDPGQIVCSERRCILDICETQIPTLVTSAIRTCVALRMSLVFKTRGWASHDVAENRQLLKSHHRAQTFGYADVVARFEGDKWYNESCRKQDLALEAMKEKRSRIKELLEQQQEQQQNEDNQQQNQDQQQDQQDQQDQNQEEQQQGQQDQQTEPPSAEEMSADEAKQLLDAMRQEEQNKRLQLHPVMGAPVNVEKDW